MVKKLILFKEDFLYFLSNILEEEEIFYNCEDLISLHIDLGYGDRVFNDHVPNFYYSNKDIFYSKAKKSIEVKNVKNMDYSFMAFSAARESYVSKDWAERIIQSDTYGDPSISAYLMVKYCGSDRKWAEKVIENDKTGSPCETAPWMVNYHGSNKSWGKKIIENARDDESVFHPMFYILKDEKEDRDWFKHIIENRKTTLTHKQIINLSKNIGIDKDWYRNIREG